MCMGRMFAKPMALPMEPMHIYIYELYNHVFNINICILCTQACVFLITLAKRAVSKAFSSVGSVARLLVPHMSLDAAAGSECASLIWSNDRRNGFRNELYHCEFVLVVGEFTKELFMEEYNGAHAE